MKPDQTYKVVTINEILPGAFQPEDLEAPRTLDNK
jgi:cytidine deaminase